MAGRLAIEIIRSPWFAAWVGLMERVDLEPENVLRVLTYHRVERADADPPPQSGVTVSPEVFSEHMAALEARCQVVSVDEVVEACAGHRRLPSRAVLITFDDGYRDFAANAWPVLRSRGLPVIVFIPTAFPGDPSRWFWWDRLHHALHATRAQVVTSDLGPMSLHTPTERDVAFARLRARAKDIPHEEALAWVERICQELAVAAPRSPVMDWAEIRGLAAQGVAFGSHTRTHPLLTRISIAEARRELEAARHDLERELGRSTQVLAYPAGAFDDHVVRAARDAGYRLGFTTARGVNPLSSADPLRLRRFNVGRATTTAVLRGQLTGWFARMPAFRAVPTAP